MVHRLRQRHAHEAGRGERAIEPRQLHHLDDGAHAGALVADPQRESLGELDFARRIGAVAELVLEPLQPQRIDRAIGPKARHEKTGQPARRLRQHQKGVAHRRGEKPLVPGDRIGISGRRRGRGVGAHVGAALLFGHAHAERHARLFPPRAKRRVVAAGDDFRRDLRQQRRLGGERRQRGARHGDRAQVPALDLRRHVVARRARRLPPAARRACLPASRSRHAVPRRCSPASARDRPDGTRPRRGESPWGRRCGASADSRWRGAPARTSPPCPIAARRRTAPPLRRRRRWPRPPPSAAHRSKTDRCLRKAATG